LLPSAATVATPSTSPQRRDHVATITPADWNPTASACWNRLRTSLAREYGDLDFYRAVEVQQRGALHLHIPIATRSELDVLRVQQLALAAGFGCVLDLAPLPWNADFSHLASYVSKQVAGYITKSAGQRDDVPWRTDVADDATGEIRRLHTRPTYRSHSQSRSWGITIGEIRAVHRAQARKRAAALQAAGDPQVTGTPAPLPPGSQRPVSAASDPP
jgi:hypothetical protein